MLIIIVLVLWLVWVRQQEQFTSKEIPKIIWTYWRDETIPYMIRRCIDSWKKYNPDYEIRILNKNSIREWIRDIDIENMKMNDSPARESDLVRLSILPIYGGIWADASIIMNRSMDYIRNIQKEKGCEFIGYYSDAFTARPEYPVVESWFFGCVPGSSFMLNWRDEFFKLNTYNSPKDYVDSKRAQGIDLQDLKWIEYLAIHVSAQAVMQTLMTPHEVAQKLHFMKAEDGPLKHVSENLSESLINLCKQGNSSPFIKLRNADRDVILKNKELECVYNNF